MAKKIGLIPKEALMKRIGATYAAAARAITSILRGLDPGTYTASAGSSALAKIRAIVNGLDMSAAEWARRSIAAAYGESRGVAETRLGALGAERPRPKKRGAKPDRTGKSHAKAIARYVKLTTRDYLKANRTILTTAGKYLSALDYARRKLDSYRAAEIEAFTSADVRGIIDSVVKQATGSHLERKAVDSKILKKLLSVLGGQDFITINGRDYNLRSYAELVARTRMRDAQTEAVVEMCEEFGTDLVEIPRHDDPCPLCKEHQGKVYSISGNHPDYPELPDGGPPFHPNCECVMNPTTELALKWRNK